MDDKKNVSFVSGLALILSALALLLIGVSQISSTPYTENLEEIIDARMNALEQRVDTKIVGALKAVERSKDEESLRELQRMQTALQSWSTNAPTSETYSGQVAAMAGITLPLSDAERQRHRATMERLLAQAERHGMLRRLRDR